MNFTRKDLLQMKKRGISPKDAARQLRLFRNPPKTILLDRSCTLGDGIHSFPRTEIQRFIKLAEEARFTGRFMKFVPASGGLSRMLKSLYAIRNAQGHNIHAGLLGAHALKGNTDAREVLSLMN